MDRKQDASKDLLNKVTILIENNKILELRELLEEYHIIDIFEIMENLEENEKIKLFEVLPLDLSLIHIQMCIRDRVKLTDIKDEYVEGTLV